MVELTEEQWLKFYGIEFIEDEDGCSEAYGPSDSWKPDFTDWIAARPTDDDEWEECWGIAPKPFWDANKCIPDHSISFEVPGFWQSSEHILVSDLEDPEQALRDLGFTVLVNPKWWYELRNSENKMAPHQQRVVDEKAELDERLSKLTAFIADTAGVFGTLPEDEQDRLIRQRTHMLDYTYVLGQRIAAFPGVN